MRSFLVLAVLLLACGHTPDSGGSAPPTATADPAGEPTHGAEPGPATGSSTPTSPGSTVVIARVLSSGPVGSGRCVQCSHEIAVETSLEGNVAASATPIWAHFEWCEGDADYVPQPGGVNPCSLDTGSRYELRLDPGGSANFPSDLMILDARPH